MINKKQIRTGNARIVEIYTDFIHSAGGFNTSTVGSNAVVQYHVTNDTGGRPGSVRLVSGTTSSGYARCGLIFSNTILLGFGEWSCETAFFISQLNNSTDAFFTIFGFVNNPTAITNGVYVLYSAANNNFELVIKNNGITNTYNTGVLVQANTWYSMSMSINKDATSVKLTINGTTIEVANADIPKTPGRTVDYGIGIFNTLGTVASRHLTSDYLGLYGQR